MERIDPKDFLAYRTKNNPLSKNEADGFDYYMTQKYLSMNHRNAKGAINLTIISFLDMTNTYQFYKLPKSVQAYAYTALNGMKLLSSWKVSKKKESGNIDDIIYKVKKVLDCTYNDAKYFVLNKSINLDDIEEIYDEVFNTDSFSVGTVKKSRSKSG